MTDEFDFFCLQMNTKVFFKMIVSLYVYVARHAQSTQSNKFAISLQYIKKNMKGEVDFLPAGKPQKFLQIDTIILGVCSQACSNFPKKTSLLFLCNILRENDEVMKLIFLHVDKHESLLQIDITIGMVKYSQSSQNITFAMFLQYLKKQVRGDIDFCM